MLREFASVTAVGVLAGAAFGVAPQAKAAQAAAQPTSIKACWKKSTGQIRFVKSTKKCKRGWKKVVWNRTGPSGPTGPAGPNFVVKDRNGTTLGRFSGYYSTGLVPEIVVTASDGGIFRYRTDGTLINDDGLLYFRDAACTQAAVFSPVAAGLQFYLKSAGGPGRAVFQVTGALTANAYRVDAATTAVTTVGANALFLKNATTGACTATANVAGFIVPLADAPAPALATPPLSVVAP